MFSEPHRREASGRLGCRGNQAESLTSSTERLFSVFLVGLLTLVFSKHAFAFSAEFSDILFLQIQAFTRF